METKKIGEIREEFKAAEETMLPSFIEKYRSDERAGVQKLIEQANGRLAKLEAERARIDRLWKYEREYGMYTRICGIDEVGRGPLAGPVVAGAVILPKDCDILYINDSKKLSAAKREEPTPALCAASVTPSTRFGSTSSCWSPAFRSSPSARP